MDRPNKRSKKGRKVPRVPIKTYKWEDVRRSRRKGGYPWTYLYKKPFDEIINIEEYRMDPTRKSKSASTIEKSSDVEIQELTDDDKGSNVEEGITTFDDVSDRSDTNEITALRDDISKEKLSDRVQIEECTVDVKETPKVEFILESAESSDNISQYLDNEERQPQTTKNTNTPDASGTSTNINSERGERAKSEETKRKRKLSIESSRSKISLSSLGVLRKIKETKDKIKVPKMSFPTSNIRKSITKKNGSPKEVKRQPVQTQSQDVKPVYIHIPLKPPPGETDEFSHLEFGEKGDISKTKEPRKINPKFRDMLKNLKKLNDGSLMEGAEKENTNKEQDIEDEEHNIVADYNSGEGKEKSKMPDADTDDDQPNKDTQSDSEDKTEPDIFDKLFEAQSIKSSEAKSNEVEGERQTRAKSAEPERKRKFSLESSYSRKSLSQLGFLKKIKDASEKLKFPSFTFSRTSSKKEKGKSKDDTLADTKKEVKEPKKAASQLSTSKTSEPVYIHIPLKPPEGQSDEFSHLEFEEKQSQENSIATSPDTPESPQSKKINEVQLIFVTAPSDDEVLDDHSIPDTPLSENKFNFDNRIEELKTLAKDVVDEISPETKQKILETVEEENGSDKIKVDDIEEQSMQEGQDIETKDNEENVEEHISTDEVQEKVTVDEEDGLKSSNLVKADSGACTKTEKLDTKSNLKKKDSPVLKKKVSFKRRAKVDTKDRIYEDVQTPDTQKSSEGTKGADLKNLENSQSMSVDEEKTYLDDKIIKSTSLEEDYNKWSKLSDHEYEPINPPPENVTFDTAPPTVHIIDTDRAPHDKEMTRPDSPLSLEQRTLTAVVQPVSSTFMEESNIKVDTSTDVIQPNEDNPNAETKLETTDRRSKFHQTCKLQADKFKTKLRNIKRPSITLAPKSQFQKPNQQRFKMERPKFNLPKIPATTKIHLPTINLPRINTTKRTLKERPEPTESVKTDSKKAIFDFSTYPRLFKKKQKNEFENSGGNDPIFATVPRMALDKQSSEKQKEKERWTAVDTIRIPLHSENSMDNGQNEESIDADNEREDSVERRMASHIRYNEDIDIDDEYERENQTPPHFHQEYNSRWDHGNFHPDPNQEFQGRNAEYKVTDLDSPEDYPTQIDSFDNSNRETHSSQNSLGHRRGVLEEINADEFFLRQKGISQDNIDVGMYLSSEIREAFRIPTNALSQMQDDSYLRDYEIRGSNQSLPEQQSKRKPIKKPKRKKTPHVSQEQIKCEEESEPETYPHELPPLRPKRRSRKSKRSHKRDIIPYQEIIPVEPEDNVLQYHVENLGILGKSDDDYNYKYKLMYENEQMDGKEQPDITITDPYKGLQYADNYESNEQFSDEHMINEQEPVIPPRKQKSLKSLNTSEQDSILGEYNTDAVPISEIEIRKLEHEYIIPTPEVPPKRPSRTRSHSQEDSVLEKSTSDEIPTRPFRSRSSSGEKSLPHDDGPVEEVCIEKPCIKDIRDYMGYAIIDKQKVRDPPLPPPRMPPRRKRSIKSTTSETRFNTVPRSYGDGPPVRPLRNYSTLGSNRPSGMSWKRADDDNKENIDISQYLETEDESNRDLQSGEVIQKIQNRPLPAPPRPPRKGRTLRDITSLENIRTESQQNVTKDDLFEEIEVSTQTEPLTDDFVCEDVKHSDEVEVMASSPETEPVIIQKVLITPSHYTHEETITHGALIVEPLNGAKIIPDSELTKQERIINVTQEFDEDESSEIPEDFKKLQDPEQPSIKPQANEAHQGDNTKTIHPLSHLLETEGIEILKAQKLQISDLDVDRLTVNELTASKITVAEIDSRNMQVNEISSTKGALKIGEIELPQAVVQELLFKLGSAVEAVAVDRGNEKHDTLEDTPEDNAGEKKTSIENLDSQNIQQASNKTTAQQGSITNLEELYVSENGGCTTESKEELVSNTHQKNTLNDPSPETLSISDIISYESEVMACDVIDMEINKKIIPEELQALPEPSSRSTEILRSDNEFSCSNAPPERPPRHTERTKVKESISTEEIQRPEEPDVDDSPPPRPPRPPLEYIPSQPPASFYALKAQKYVETLDENIPVVPRRRLAKPPISRSTSEESQGTPPTRRRFRSPEPSVSQLTGQLFRACGSSARINLKRLIIHLTNNVLGNADGKQDMHVMIIILLVLIAGLLLLGYGDEKTVHLHHWEFFNPPRDM